MILEIVLVLELFLCISSIFGTLPGPWGAMGAPRTSHWAQNRISIDLEPILDSQSGGFSAIINQKSYGVLAAFFEGVLARRPLLLFVRGGICLVFLILRFPLFYN